MFPAASIRPLPRAGARARCFPLSRAAARRRLAFPRPALALALALLAPAAGCSRLHAHAGSTWGTPQPAPVKAVLTLKPFLVNLADPGGTSFLRTSVALGLSAPAAANTEGTPLVAEVRDTIITVLTASTSAELLAPQGKATLKVRLLQAVHAKVPKLPVTAVYLTDFLIQR